MEGGGSVTASDIAMSKKSLSSVTPRNGSGDSFLVRLQPEGRSEGPPTPVSEGQPVAGSDPHPEVTVTTSILQSTIQSVENFTSTAPSYQYSAPPVDEVDEEDPPVDEVNEEEHVDEEDPNPLQKPPRNAYMLFYSMRFQAYRVANPSFSITQIGSLAGREWNELPDEEKASFEARLVEMKAAYAEKVGKGEKSAAEKKKKKRSSKTSSTRRSTRGFRVRPSYANLIELCNTMVGVFREQLARENALRKPHTSLWTAAVLALPNLSEETKLDAIEWLKADTEACFIFMALVGAMRERFLMRKFGL